MFVKGLCTAILNVAAVHVGAQLARAKRCEAHVGMVVANYSDAPAMRGVACVSSTTKMQCQKLTKEYELW